MAHLYTVYVARCIIWVPECAILHSGAVQAQKKESPRPPGSFSLLLR